MGVELAPDLQLWDDIPRRINDFCWSCFLSVGQGSPRTFPPRLSFRWERVSFMAWGLHRAASGRLRDFGESRFPLARLSLIGLISSLRLCLLTCAKPRGGCHHGRGLHCMGVAKAVSGAGMFLAWDNL
jgi:hypothetical protein